MTPRAQIPKWTRKWAGDTGVLLVSQAQVTIVTTLLAVLLARSLGPADWGIFSTLLSLSQGASLFVDIGLNNYLLREVSRVWARDERAPRAELERESARLMRLCIPVNVWFGSLLVLAFGAGALALGLSLELSGLLAALMAYVVLIAVSAGLETTLRAQRRTGLILTGVLLDKVVLLAGVGVTLYADLGFPGLAVSHLLAGLCHVAFAYTFTLLPVPRPSERPPILESLATVKLSFPFAFNMAALNFIPRFDLTIVAAFSTVAASYYAIGERVVFAIIIVPTVAGMALYPFLAREESATRSAIRAASIMAIGGGAFAAGAAALAPIVLPALFGSEYDESIWITQIMLIALPFMFASNALIPGLYESGRERRLFAVTAPAALLGSVGVLVGQLLFGVVGAATAFVARQVLFAGVLLALSISKRQSAGSDEPGPESRALAVSPAGPVVDIGVPTRGQATFLAAAVESVMSQDFENWRLTISYNGAAETEPPRGLAPFLGDPRVRFVPTGEEVSAAENHTRLVRAGSAPYLAILHDDDLWQPTFLSRRLHFLESHPQAGWVFSETAIIDEQGEELRRSQPALRTGMHHPAEFLPALLNYNYAGVPSRVLIRRRAFDAVGPFFDDRFLYWDWELWVRLAAKFPSGYLPDTDVATRIHSEQSTFRFRPDRGEQLEFRSHLEDVARRSGLNISRGVRETRRPRSDILLSQALDDAEDQNRRAALSALMAALRAYPPSLVDLRVPALLAALPFGRRGARWLARGRNRVLALGTRRGFRFHRR